ncbi:MAG: hypothetical protein ACREFP_09285 [Acetobacteraceae bacterium]
MRLAAESLTETASYVDPMAESRLLTSFSTTTMFGAPADVTLSELALEAFFPANAETKQRLARLAA